MDNSYWEQRTGKIKEEASLRRLLDHYNIKCLSQGAVTQIHCPFHGADRHASARLYESNEMYCWVCSKKWDVISFTKDINNFDSYAKACAFLEDMFSIERPDAASFYKEPDFNDYLKEKEKEEIDVDFDHEFSRLSSLILRNRDVLEYDDYVKYYYYLDNLYSKYRLNKDYGKLSLQLSLSNLNEEILSKT